MPERFTAQKTGFDWVQPTDAIRGHWLSADGCGIEVYPPSEGYTQWMVVVPHDRREVLVQMLTGEEAYVYATETRKARAN